jgi:hypothetical protein
MGGDDRSRSYDSLPRLSPDLTIMIVGIAGFRQRGERADAGWDGGSEDQPNVSSGMHTSPPISPQVIEPPTT